MTTRGWLQVPWANLGREPVICELDSIYVLAVPNTGEAQTVSCSNTATLFTPYVRCTGASLPDANNPGHQGKDVDEAELEQANKRQKVDEAENEFIKVDMPTLCVCVGPGMRMVGALHIRGLAGTETVHLPGHDCLLCVDGRAGVEAVPGDAGGEAIPSKGKPPCNASP